MTRILFYDVLHLYCALAEFVGWEGYGFPFWAALLHEFLVFIQFDAEKNVLSFVEIVDWAAIGIYINIFNMQK